MNRVPLLRPARRMAARAASVCARPGSAASVSRVERLEYRVLLATFTVTTAADSGPGSLREAITLANTAAGADTIAFNIPGAGVHTIAPLSSLPAVTGTLNLDAATQPGYVGAPLIELIGTLPHDPVSGVANGLVINAGPTLVRGLAVNRFRGDGIVLGAGATGSRVEACYVGTNAAGTQAAGNGGAGIRVGAAGVVIGGGGVERRNVVSGNDTGIVLEVGPEGTGVVSGNFVGIDAAGLHTLGNRTFGIELLTSAPITIGGTQPAARNVISGNGGSGVFAPYSPTSSFGRGALVGNYIGTDAVGSNAVPNGTDQNAIYHDGVTQLVNGRAITGNLISGNRGNGVTLTENPSALAGNYIGTDSTGRRALGNEGNGIQFTSLSATIGAAGPSAVPPVIDPGGAGRNVISANWGHGILASSPSDARILNNYIGVSADGTLPLGNRGSGVYSAGALSVGGSRANEGNVISANGRDGVTMLGLGSVRGNRIGTNAAGDDSTPAFGNAGNGVLLGDGTVNVTTTRTATVSNNTIAFNGANGVLVQGSAAAGAKATISQNSIFSNGKLGIDLATPFQGVSDLHPLILRAVSDGQVTLVRYKGLGTVEFFASPEPDPSGFGEGKTFLRAVLGDGTEQTARLPAVAPGMFITATSTVSTATSEFSNAPPVAAGVVEPAASVVDRYLFYNQSYFDHFLQGFGDELSTDDDAIDRTKRALLPGQTATFSNVSSYSKGLNGVMFDMKDMALGTQPPNVEVKVGIPGASPGDPVTWTEGPRPTTIARRNGAGVNKTDRITLIWPNGAIKNQWLRVTVKADAVSWLPRDDVFYFGNLVGETGDAATPLWVSAVDFNAARQYTRFFPGSVGIQNQYDIDRDGVAGPADVAAVRSNLFHRLPALTAPPATPAPVITASPLRRKRPSEEVGLLG